MLTDKEVVELVKLVTRTDECYTGPFNYTDNNITQIKEPKMKKFFLNIWWKIRHRRGSLLWSTRDYCEYGRVVTVIQWRGDLVIVTEFGMWQISQNNIGSVEARLIAK